MVEFNYDLYDQILEYEKPNMDFEDFIDQLVENTQLRDDFLQDYVDEIVDSMTPREIAKAYGQIILNSLNSRVTYHQEDLIVKECYEQFPYILERFNVNVKED
jgi:hypothetical protein